LKLIAFASRNPFRLSRLVDIHSDGYSLLLLLALSTLFDRRGLVDLLVREPFGRLQVLLLQWRVEHTQSPYLAG
jgi:hypothetical protein